MAASRAPDTLVAWIAAVVASGPNRLAAIGDGDTWTYGRLWDRAREVASWLLREPAFEPGSRVAIIGANDPGYLAAYCGVLRAGGVVVPLNPMLSVADLHKQLEFVGCAGTLVGEASAEQFEGIRERTPIWHIRDAAGTGSVPLPAVGPRTPACVLLTSGSTGSPKGVLHSHGTMLHAALQIAAAFPFGRDDRNVAFLPFFASIPEQVLPTLVSGGSLDIISRFDVERVSAACRSATCFDAVPTIMARLLDEGDLDALRHLRWVMFASEPMPAPLLERWWDELPGCETYQLYGMTEMLTITQASDRLQRQHPGVVGVPFATSAVSIIDDRGTEVPQGTAGEVICRSPARMAKYLHDGEATARALTQSGAMRTGDVGLIDERGHLRLTGRLKDLIISGGLNIAPAEIEAVACQHPLVSAAAVVGIPDARWGETPVVVAVTPSTDGATAAEILQFCRSQLTGFKRPTAAAVLDALPVTGIGKSSKAEILRRVLDGEVELVRAG